MISLYVWILLVNEAFGSISIKIEPPVVKIDNSDIDIRCIVDGTTLTSILSIKLNRSNTIGSNTTVVTVTSEGVFLGDAALENTTGVTVNASVSNVSSSYLHLEIPKTVVRYPEDMGSYQCSLTALDSIVGLVKDHSLIVNITGLRETTIATRDFTTAFSTEQFVQEGTFKRRHKTKILDHGFTASFSIEQYIKDRNFKISTKQFLQINRAVLEKTKHLRKYF